MTSPAPARLLLREATRAAHERLHHLPAFADLAAGRLGRDGYVALLGRLYGFHAPGEAVIAATLEGAPGALSPAAWRRADLLRQDLLDLGVPAPSIAGLPTLETGPPRNRATALGRLYVLVGSTLGGRVLARRLDGMLPPGSTEGRRFLTGGSASLHTGWAAFGAAIDAGGTTTADRADMVAGAHDCFARFDLWFRAGLSR